MTELKDTLLLLLLLSMMLMAVSCSDHDEIYMVPSEDFASDTTATTSAPDTTDTVPVIPSARITGEVTYPAYPLLRNLNFVYPSKDPWGKPVMLSGTITMSRSMTSATKARGFILYNHYTVCRADECPSKGKLDMQNIIYELAPYRNFITVSADYYGFGETEDQMQAYCVASTNARASLDALTAARQLLADEGYTWYNELLNVGYSQGGQTTMAVLRMATEEYPDIRFSRTLAGGGPYDLEATYREYLADGKAKLPSAVVNILMAYNEYFHLGISAEEMFQEPTLSHIDDWWLSKQYSSTTIDRKMGTGDITQFIAPPLRDLDSDVSKRMMEALGRENLCQGWTPRSDEHILLLHHENDEIVPLVNTRNMYDFLKRQGVEDVELRVNDYFSLGISDHVSGAVAFLTIVALWIRDEYEIS